METLMVVVMMVMVVIDAHDHDHEDGGIVDAADDVGDGYDGHADNAGGVRCHDHGVGVNYNDDEDD